MAKLRITQVILGIRRMHQTVEVEKTPVSMGMLEKVRHLVKVEEID